MISKSTTSDAPSPTRENDAPASSSRKRTKFRLSRLALKELRETLRDRRTIVTLVLMPLIVYPILSLVFKTFLMSNVGLLGSGQPLELYIAYGGDADEQTIRAAVVQVGDLLKRSELEESAVSSEEGGQSSEGPNGTNQFPSGKSANVGSLPNQSASKNLANGLTGQAAGSRFSDFDQHKWIFIPTDSETTLEELVESAQVDVGLSFDFENRERWQIAKVDLVSRNDGISTAAAEHLLSKFKQLNDFDLKLRLRRFDLPTRPTLEMETSTVGAGQENESKQAFPLASLVPLILVLMTITGAVYPAIDLTAGERERGTLETLMAAPIPRMGILISKFIAVLTVAILTAMLNLIGMLATVWAFQLDKQFGGGMFNVTALVQIFLLLILFAAFFSALLLAVTSFAKSFKEAQVYLIPIILLSLGPGLMAMAPGMSLDGVNAVTPMVNILLLARDVLQNQVMLVPSVIAVVSTLLYTYLAIRLAARIFGSDSILYSGGGSVAEMFQRPAAPNRVVPFMATMFCLVMLFPINFASIGFLGRMPGDSTADLEIRYLTMAVCTFFAFMVLPWLVAKHQHTLIGSGFGLRVPKLVFVLAAILLGVSLWPIVMSLTSGWHEIYGFLFGSAKQDEWHDRLVETTSEQVARIRMVSPLVIAIAFSIVPAICEEWFFRGMLLRSLLKSNSVWKAILISAAIFGSFHMLSNSVIALDRLVPSTVMGIMLGYLAYKSGSILPGIILHALNNAIVIFLAYYQESLSELSWFPGEEESIPVIWVLIGCCVAAMGVAMVWTARTAVDK